MDKAGQPHLLSEVLPQLDSTPAGEGMHIIYAAQSAPLRRSVEDVAPFERSIYSYLGLTDVRIAIRRLEAFLKEHEETESELAGQVNEKRTNFETEQSQLVGLRNRIIENPPWGQGSIPPYQETANRIGGFIKELSSAAPSEQIPPSGLEPSLLISEVEKLFERVRQSTTNETENALHQTEQRLAQGEMLRKDLDNLNRQVELIQSQSVSVEQELAALLADETVDTLAQATAEAEKQAEEIALLHDLQKKALSWLERRMQSSEDQYCPVCKQVPQASDLADDIKGRVSQASNEEVEIVAKRDALRARHMEALRLSAQLGELHDRETTLQQELEQAREKVIQFVTGYSEGQDVGSALQEYMNELYNTKTIQQKRLQETTTQQEEWKRRLDRLQEEVRFHRVQEQLRELQNQQQQLQRVEEALRNLALFGDSVKSINEALTNALINTLNRTLPDINKNLTEAFKILTEHPAYDLVFIDSSNPPNLELRVASEDDPLPGWQPSQVLNAQALNALEVVPYFTFSEITDMPFEVYLLLLDDPTQSFDSHHIDILVRKLAELGKHVQLIVASHEVEDIDSLLSEYFGPDEYRVVHVTGFSRKDGPKLEI